MFSAAPKYTVIPSFFMSHCYELEEIVIPEGVEEIPEIEDELSQEATAVCSAAAVTEAHCGRRILRMQGTGVHYTARRP